MPLFNALRRRLALVGMLLVAAHGAALAEFTGDDRDSGLYQIQQARYGTADRNVDVTQRLKELARTDQRFRMGNDTFGTDPAPGQVKTLRIYATDRGGQPRTFEYREGVTIDGAQFTAWGGGGGGWGQGQWNGGWQGQGNLDGEFQIIEATYGTRYRSMDVTATLVDMARRDRNFRLENRVFGNDPHPGEPKALEIRARNQRGQVRTFRYAEGSMVDAAIFGDEQGNSWHGNGHGNGNGNNGNHYGQGGDAGQYTIQSARYGTYDRNIDVTARLSELARQDRSFRMGNDTFGTDPAPGQVKTLRIEARGPDGRNRTFEYREGSTVDGAQFTGWSGGGWGGGSNQAITGGLRIISAVYGTGRQSVDVTDRLQARVYSGRLAAKVNNDLAGTDPAPNRPKSLVVTYSVNGGRQQSTQVDENSYLSLP